MRRREQEDTFEVFLGRKKPKEIPSSNDGERFSTTKWYLHPSNQTDPTGDTLHLLLLALLLLFFLPFSSYKSCSLCLVNSLLSPLTAAQVNKKEPRRGDSLSSRRQRTCRPSSSITPTALSTLSDVKCMNKRGVRRRGNKEGK